jgi:hypothetical protein
MVQFALLSFQTSFDELDLMWVKWGAKIGYEGFVECVHLSAGTGFASVEHARETECGVED